MKPFHPPAIADKPWVDTLLALGGQRGAEHSFASIFTWAEPFRQEIADLDGFLARRLHSEIGPAYLWPVGRGDPAAALAVLRSDAIGRGQPLRFVCLTGEQVGELERLCPGEFAIQRDPGDDDYLYDIDRMADFSGKKLHQKRNHVNRFMDAYPLWAYEPLTPANIAECMEMDEEWHRRKHGGTPGSLAREEVALRRALTHFSGLGLEGGLIRAGGRVLAFTLGALISRDTFGVHFEKAFGEIQGAYPMMTQQFARWIRANYPAVRHLNREEDMNVESLRRAKRSFGPDLMLEKHTAVQRP